MGELYVKNANNANNVLILYTQIQVCIQNLIPKYYIQKRLVLSSPIVCDVKMNLEGAGTKCGSVITYDAGRGRGGEMFNT